VCRVTGRKKKSHVKRQPLQSDQTHCWLAPQFRWVRTVTAHHSPMWLATQTTVVKTAINQVRKKMTKTARKTASEKPKHTIEYFKRGNNDQKDHKVFDAMQEFLGKGFDLYKKSVCFKGRANKNAWRGAAWSNGKSLAQACVCIKTFYSISRKFQNEPHVALVEGVIGRIPTAKLPRGVSQPKKGSPVDFHALLVIVDPILKTVGVFNPWLPGQVRSGIVKRVQDIRPKLIAELVSLYNKYDIYHSSGKQKHTSDCRVHCLQFAKQLGTVGRNHYLRNTTEIAWKPIKH
jgi:hypothetical protein